MPPKDESPPLFPLPPIPLLDLFPSPDSPSSLATSLSNSDPPDEMPSPSDDGSQEVVVVVVVGVEGTSPRDAGRGGGVVGAQGSGESGVVGKNPSP